MNDKPYMCAMHKCVCECLCLCIHKHSMCFLAMQNTNASFDAVGHRWRTNNFSTMLLLLLLLLISLRAHKVRPFSMAFFPFPFALARSFFRSFIHLIVVCVCAFFLTISFILYYRFVEHTHVLASAHKHIRH